MGRAERRAKETTEKSYDMFCASEADIMHESPFVTSSSVGMHLVPPYSGLGHADIGMPIVMPIVISKTR